MPERPSPPPEDQKPERERYHRAAQFSGEQAAGRAYFQAQELIYEVPCELSAYRFHIKYVFFVAVLGLAPSPEVDEKIQEILAPGTSIELPPQVLVPLFNRRTQETQKGSWVEHHHRHKNRKRKGK